MDHLILPVVYKNEELNFPITIYRSGFTFQIMMDIYGTRLSFERDEELELRALLAPGEKTRKEPDIDPGLLEAIMTSLRAIFS